MPKAAASGENPVDARCRGATAGPIARYAITLLADSAQNGLWTELWTTGPLTQAPNWGTVREMANWGDPARPGPDPAGGGPGPAGGGPDEDRAGPLRNRMVDALVERGIVVSEAVGRALRAVPRHLFVPQEDLAGAYLDEAIVVKRDGEGHPVSSASQPAMVAIMLEMLAVAPGDRVLEIGTGTGYNTALLAELSAPSGRVTTIEVEEDLAEKAQTRLSAVRTPVTVEVLVGDGRLGYAPGAPYQRIIVTAGADHVPGAWSEQLSAGGRLVVPLVDRTGLGNAMAYVKDDEGLREIGRSPCAFLLLRPGSEGTGGRG